MFNFFKRKDKTNSLSARWGINKIDGFEKIHNRDSIQYVNEDESKIIYFSFLNTSGSDILGVDTFREPTIIDGKDEWQLKGFKKFENQILVCVISLKKQEDIEWAKSFFNSINPIQN